MNNPNSQATYIPPGEGRKSIVLGQEIAVKLNSSETGGNFFLFEDLVPPGSRVPPHLHEREDEILEVIEGELEVSLGGRSFTANAGAIAFFARHVVHGFGNASNAPARARFVVSPGANFERFFEALSALPPDQPPDMPRVMEIFGRYGLRIVTGMAGS